MLKLDLILFSLDSIYNDNNSYTYLTVNDLEFFQKTVQCHDD